MKDKKDPAEDISFTEAMQGVTRHSHNKADLQQNRIKKADGNSSYRRKAATKAEEKVVDGLSDEAVSLVESNDELVFANPGVQFSLLKRLKQGHVPWEQGIDLHGYTIDQARDLLSKFIYEARRDQNRCVLVVHGKAHTSDNQQATIKSYVNEWLKRLNGVLAFCSAQPKDGGTGAVYVLLQKLK